MTIHDLPVPESERNAITLTAAGVAECVLVVAGDEARASLDQGDGGVTYVILQSEAVIAVDARCPRCHGCGRIAASEVLHRIDFDTYNGEVTGIRDCPFCNHGIATEDAYELLVEGRQQIKAGEVLSRNQALELLWQSITEHNRQPTRERPAERSTNPFDGFMWVGQ